MADEKKIREIYGVKSVLDEAAERIEATWREKLLRETGDLRTENALLRAQLDEFNRKLVEATNRNEKIEADCNERIAFIEAVAMVDEIERLRGERDAALKAQAELNDALLAQRDLMAEVVALKDRLAATEQRAAVAEAKVEVMTQMKGE